MNDSCIIQCCQSIIETLLAIIMTVIISGVYSFYRPACQNRSIGCRCFKRKCFVLPFIRIGECSFKIRNSQIICGKNIFYIDMNEVVCDEEGNLKSSLTFDDIHLYGSKYGIWVDYLKENGI